MPRIHPPDAESPNRKFAPAYRVFGAKAAIIRIALIVTAVFGVLAASLTPREGAAMAAIFPMSLGPSEVMERIAAADASLIAMGAAPWIVVVTDGRPNLADRLRAAGAFLVLNDRAAEFCAPLTKGNDR